MRQFELTRLVLFVISLAASCESTSAAHAEADTSPSLAPGEAPSWGRHVEPLLSFSCGGCHADVSKSCSCVGITFRVAPGDPDASFLVRKIEGTHGAEQGEIMPPGGDSPSADDCRVRRVREWIERGAPND